MGMAPLELCSEQPGQLNVAVLRGVTISQEEFWQGDDSKWK